MSKGQTLRALVNERLTAAAEDIFALFERTIAEYEEELCRSKEENERKQQLLDSVLSPQIELHRQDVQPQTQSPCLDQGNPDSSQIKENSEILSIKKERDLFQEFTCVVKSESEEQSENDEDWETPAGSSTQVKTEADENDYSNQDYTEDSDRALFSPLHYESISTNQTSTESSNTAVNNDSCVREEGKEIRKNECYFCKKNFRDKHHLKRHLVVHTGEKPFQCPVCAKCYSHKDTLRSHMALHNWSKKSDEGDQGCSSLMTKTLQPGPGSIAGPTKNTPFSCPICLKGFTKSFALRQHILIHTGEKPFSCPVCNKRFSQKVYVRKHMRTHTGEKPFTCLQCNMRFSRKSNLNRHSKVHAQKS